MALTLALPLLILVGGAHAALPPPTKLMVEHLPEPNKPGELLVVSTHRPRFNFLPHAADAHPGAGKFTSNRSLLVICGYLLTLWLSSNKLLAIPGVAMQSFRIVVTSVPPGGGWDSGIVKASAAVGVPCGKDLTPGHYT